MDGTIYINGEAFFYEATCTYDSGNGEQEPSVEVEVNSLNTEEYDEDDMTEGDMMDRYHDDEDFKDEVINAISEQYWEMKEES